MVEFGSPSGPDPSRIANRVEFAQQLSLVRSRAGKTIRSLAGAVHQPSGTIGGYFSGQHLPGVAQTELFKCVLGHLGITDATEIEQWVDALARVRHKPGPRPAGAPIPYRGLESFRTEDSKFFFGREMLTDAVVQRASELVSDPAKGPMIAVVGPSGSGKSSLLRAGIVPAVNQGRLDLGSPWRCILMCPGIQPTVRLAEELARETGNDPIEVEHRLRNNPFDWPALPDRCDGLLLVVDQFEEVFTSCPDEQERKLFLAMLAGPSRAQASQRARVVVILGLRADFYSLAAREPSLVPVLQDHQVVVGPMSAEELRSAIIEPARLVGFDVDEELVDLLVGEAAPRGSVSGGQDPGALPLLSHALRETWERARRGRLTIADYRATGGIAGAVQQSAERLFDELTSEEQTLTRRLFLRLVNVDDHGVATRRRVQRAELPRAGFHNASSTGSGLDRVIDRFVSQRLLTAHVQSVEVSHEALLTAWPRLREWMDADRDGLRVHRQLSDAARLWTEQDRDASALLRGGRLEIVQTWASSIDHRGDLNDVEELFLDTSVEHARQEALSARRRMRRLQMLVAIVVTLALAAGTLAEVAVRARRAADRTSTVALSRQLVAQAGQLRESDPSLASQLAAAAFRVLPTYDTRSALLDFSALPSATRLLGQPGATAVALTSDGHTLAVSQAIDGTVHLYGLRDNGLPTREGVLRPPAGGSDLFAIAFSPDGTTMATGGMEGVVRLWDVSDRAHPRPLGEPLRGFIGPVQTVTFTPDGKTIAAAGTAAEGVLRWDVENPEQPTSLAPLSGMSGTTQTVAFSPDGTMAAAGGTDGILRFWTMSASGPHLTAQRSTDPPTTINATAFSPDGRLLAAGNKDKTISVWDLKEGRTPTAAGPALTGFGSWVNTVAFSPDGRTLAGGSSDNTVRFWDVGSWSPREPSLPSPAAVTGVRFVPGRSNIITVATDGTARIWAWPGPLITGPNDTVWSLSFSSDGQRLAVFANHADAIDVWNPSDPQHPVRVGRVEVPRDIGTFDGSGAISSDGRFLAAGTATGKVQVWDVSNLANPVLLGPALAGPTKLVQQVAFSPDGHLVGAASDDGTVRLWDIRDPTNTEPVSTLTGPGNQVLGLSFSPDGTLLAAASSDKTVWLWNIGRPGEPALLATLTSFKDYAQSVAFSPDSKLLAAGSADRTIRLWDLTDARRPRLVGRPLVGPGNTVFWLAFDPAGGVLAAAVKDGTVWQWNVRDVLHPDLIGILTAAATSQTFVVAFSPDRSILAAGDNNAVRIWKTSPEQAAKDICRTAGNTITREEWKQYFPDDDPYTPPCK